VPLGWLIGTADQSSIDALLESIGFQVGKAGTEFMHPNILVFLDTKLRIAKWIYGTNYSGRDIDAALKIALGQADWIGQHSDVLYAMLLFAASLLCVALFHSLRQRRIRPNDAPWRNQATLRRSLVIPEDAADAGHPRMKSTVPLPEPSRGA
jgi:hypothetical protein